MISSTFLRVSATTGSVLRGARKCNFKKKDTVQAELQLLGKFSPRTAREAVVIYRYFGTEFANGHVFGRVIASPRRL